MAAPGATPNYEATVAGMRPDQLPGYDAGHAKDDEAFAKTNVMRNPLVDGKGDQEA